MAKKKRKRVASKVMSLITETSPEITAEPAVDSGKKHYAKCGVCEGTEHPTSFIDGDEHWELPGHPDHLMRVVCGQCRADYQRREKCSFLVYEAMRESLRAREMGESEIEQAVHTAWRIFWVEFDHKALVQMARKLKVKHPWLKGKRPK